MHHATCNMQLAAQHGTSYTTRIKHTSEHAASTQARKTHMHTCITSHDTDTAGEDRPTYHRAATGESREAHLAHSNTTTSPA